MADTFVRKSSVGVVPAQRNSHLRNWAEGVLGKARAMAYSGLSASRRRYVLVAALCYGSSEWGRPRDARDRSV